MTYSRLQVTHANSRLSFSVRMGSDRPWWRHLDVDGQPAYCIGNLCDTCPAVLSLVEYARLPLSPTELSQQLRTGLAAVSPEILATVAQVLPQGNYIVGLIEVHPQFHPDVTLPDGRQGNYSWTEGESRYAEATLIEGIFPLGRFSDLKPATVESYKARLEHGQKPTALALSLVETRCISGQFWEWHLAHFLLDGHHKMLAASQLGQPLNLLSFLNLDESSVHHGWLEKTLSLRYGESDELNLVI